MAQRFSNIFEIGLDQPQLDFVDISPFADTPLYIDPYAISIKEDDWSRNCQSDITHFFQTTLDHIRAGRHEQARLLLNGLSEPNETCLGLSSGRPAGRGVSGKQAGDLYYSLVNSQAAQTGLLEELADCDLFVEGIGPDKISDITTNIIRRRLIEYTHKQCSLHGIELQGTYPSGRYWDRESETWREEYVPLPLVGTKKLILVPKYSVRRSVSLNSQEFYSHHVVNFIQQEEYEQGSPLVRTLRNGTKRPPYKKSIKEKHPFSKDFLAHFAQENPDILKKYKEFHKKLLSSEGALSHKELEEHFDEVAFSEALIEHLRAIPTGNDHAADYHKAMVGVLEFIFWPNLIYPEKEAGIHDGRKRIDIRYTNAAQNGFFYRAQTSVKIAARFVAVECKNYTKDPANPEIDQLSGRFAPHRGWLGLLLYREVSDYNRLIARCRDTATEGRGFMLPLGDEQIIDFLSLIAKGARKAIDQRLERILADITS